MIDAAVEAAEKAILGAALIDPRITATCKLAATDFSVAVAGALWEAIGSAHSDGLSPDPATLAPRLRDVNVPETLKLLPSLVGLGVGVNADDYAATILDRAERRRIDGALIRIRAQLEDPSKPAADVLAFAESSLLTTTSMDVAAETLWTLDEFLDRDLPDVEWVIPGLLATGERLVLTGIEGFGKSVAMRQIGVCLAAGIHPFSLHAIRPKRVLFIDCENPERIMMAKLGDLRTVIRARGAQTGDRFTLKRYPQGLNLAEPRERLDLHHLLTLVRPDLLLIGPAYKLYVGGASQREEDLARLVTSHLDGLREEFGFALVLEHHSPHGNSEGRSVRPIGSSLWLRWPEFGLGLRPQDGTKIVDRCADLVPWRGSRDERPWPHRLEPGGPGCLPWVDPTAVSRGWTPHDAIAGGAR